MSTRVDHLVIAAASLEQGVQWCRSSLGVEPGPGGRHALMGTHNRLLKVATDVFEDAYLEIIAIDPQAAPPGRPRWFGLDEPGLQRTLASGPKLVHVVARTQELEAARRRLVVLGHDPGEVLAAGRQTPEGPLTWQITVRADGRPLCGGALPTLIRWQGRHPASTMPASGITLSRLTLHGLPPEVAAALDMPGVDLADSAPGGAIVAALGTPHGTVVLQG